MNNKRGTGSYDYIEAQDRWRWRGYYTNPITGNREVKAIYGKSKKALREKVERWLLKAEGGYIELDLTLERWADIWFDTVIADTVKIRTKETYQHIIQHYVVPNFGKVKLKNLTAQAFQDFLNKLNSQLSPNTVAKVRRYAIMCVDAAARYGYVATNTLRNTRPPRQRKNEIRALSLEELNQIIEIAKEGKYQNNPRNDDGAAYLRDCYYALIILAIDTGMRRGEVFGLKWEDVYEDYILVRNALVSAKGGEMLDTPKTVNSARKIVLGKRIITVLNEWRNKQIMYSAKYAGIFKNENGLVFTNSFGHFVSGTNFSKRCWKPILRQAGIENVRFHDLRHSHASQLLAAGVAPQIVSQRLGHGDLNVTLRVYAHLLPNMQEAARGQIDAIFGNTDSEEENESST